MKFNNYNVQISRKAIIGNNVRIGDNTIIYDNVTIGDNTIIGTVVKFRHYESIGRLSR